jgi:capsular polysaccharide biosynthesis protein
MQWRGFSRKALSRLRQAGRLGRWWLFGLLGFARPEHQRLRPPPWRVAPAAVQGQPATITVPTARPIIYGAIVPEGGGTLPNEVRGREPAIAVAEDVVLVPGHLFVDRRSGTVLPESRGVVIDARALSGLRSRPPRLLQAPQQAGEVFVADCFFTDNYGHNLLEALTRLMLLDRVPPGVEIATSIPRSATIDKLVGGLGIDPARMRYYREPLFCRRAYLPDRLVYLEEFIHPLAREAFARLRSLGRTSDVERAERIFISRSRIRRRRLINELEIEHLFERYGFRVVHPETLPVEAQIALFSEARMIAGLGGAAMHSTVFARPETKILMVSSKVWFMRTDVLINEREGQLGYVFGEPEGEAAGFGDWDWRVDPATVEAAIVAHFGL